MTVKMYEIRVRGARAKLVLDPLEGLEITALGDSDFLLTGQLIDPPALYGLLDRIHEGGLVLISMHCLGDPCQGIKPE